MQETLRSQPDSVLIIGHRGCRSYYPENSIEGFKHALEMGVDGIEWDVVVNKDKQLVISHEPFFQSEYCLKPDGSEITSEKEFNIYEMTQAEIEQFDCGSKFYEKFPDQVKIKTHKPLLQEVLEKVDLKDKIILFEVKSKQNEYGESQPEPKEMAQLIINEIKDYKYRKNIVFISFDAEILEELHKIDSEYPMIYLTYLPFRSAKRFVEDLSFKPYGLGMFYPTINKTKVKYLHKNDMKAFAWTVNDVDTAKKLIDLGLDGFVSDCPDKMLKN